MEVRRDSKGYYTLYINGVFEGNYDTPLEAANAYEQITQDERMLKELVDA